jgi:ribonuclease HI
MGESRWIEKIYTDGACSGNPGPGGWATVIYFNDGTVEELGGADRNTTNNRMEIQGAIAALNAYKEANQPQPIVIHTDSEYVRNGITKWIEGWKKKGWKTAAGKPVLNQELWEELDEIKASVKSSNVTWQYVKAHAGNPGNERADAIAVSFAQGNPIELRSGQAPEMQSPPKAQEPQTAYSATMKSSDPVLPSLLERLRFADEIASKGYLITTQELAELVGMSASAINDRGEEWVWRNWVVSRGRKEGNQILWQLERESSF